MEARGTGRAAFVAILLFIAGFLNVVYGIAAIGNAAFFTEGGNQFIISDLNTWGWVLVVVGVIQLTGSISLFGGGVWGRAIGIVGAGLGAIGSLLAVGGAYPFWSLGIFALCIFILHGLIVFGESRD